MLVPLRQALATLTPIDLRDITLGYYYYCFKHDVPCLRTRAGRRAW